MSDAPEHDPAEFKPTPARVMAATEGEPSPSAATVETITLESGGSSWSVRVLGRSGGGDASAVPLLLLGFWEGLEPQGDPQRERVVVGRSLTTMSDGDLRDALTAARPWKPPARARKRGEDPTGNRRDGATRRRRT
jgi:hypothetical protein